MATLHSGSQARSVERSRRPPIDGSGPPESQTPPRHRVSLAALAAVTIIGVVHALVVATRYHVGSFDDDGNYVLVARALAMGAGLTTKVNGVAPIVAVYPPGYPALLAPLALIWPHGLVPFRILSLVCFVALFPLTWSYLQRHQVAPAVGVVVLLLLALSPVSATYATMVMAEMPFLVVLLVLLLVLPRWQEQTRTVTAWGVTVTVLAASLIWLKEAGVGLTVGVVAWLVLRRLWRKAALVAIGTSLLMVPVLIARIAAGVALIGSRYSTEISGPYPGGTLARLTHLPFTNLSTYFYPAMGNTIVPTETAALPFHGPVKVLFAVLAWTAAPLVMVGFVTWVRHHRDVTCVAVPIYFLETLLFPYINERRVILVLPVILACYVLGAWTVLAPLVRASRTAPRKALTRGVMAVPVASLTLVVGILIPQFPRDYLFGLHQHSSAPAGSPYLAFLRTVGHPDDIVETSYLWTTTLFSDHLTAKAAFNTPDCDRSEIEQALKDDNAGFLLSAALNEPDIADGTCLVPLIANDAGVIRLYRTRDDLASVFELVGPGTPHPDLRDLVPASHLTSGASTISEAPEQPQMSGDPAGSYPTTPSVAGQATLTWSWNGPQPVSQISLGAASGEPAPIGPASGVAPAPIGPASGGEPAPVVASPTASVVVDVEGPDGGWRRVLAAPGPVGATDSTRYLLANFPTPVVATAVRVTVATPGLAAVHDLHVLGVAP